MFVATNAIAQTPAIVTATIYHAVKEQTNEDYLTTASGANIDSLNPERHRYLAVSRDLETLGFTLGTSVQVTGAGELSGVWHIEDRMNKRWTKRIDFLVDTSRKGGKWEGVKLSLVRDK